MKKGALSHRRDSVPGGQDADDETGGEADGDNASDEPEWGWKTFN